MGCTNVSLRWINWHLAHFLRSFVYYTSNCQRGKKIYNFSSDLNVCTIFKIAITDIVKIQYNFIAVKTNAVYFPELLQSYHQVFNQVIGTDGQEMEMKDKRYK